LSCAYSDRARPNLSKAPEKSNFIVVIGKAGLSLIAFCAIDGAGIALPVHRRPKEQMKFKSNNNSQI
jgi:hypothetical protein